MHLSIDSGQGFYLNFILLNEISKMNRSKGLSVLLVIYVTIKEYEIKKKSFIIYIFYNVLYVIFCNILYSPCMELNHLTLYVGLSCQDDVLSTRKTSHAVYASARQKFLKRHIV